MKKVLHGIWKKHSKVFRSAERNFQKFRIFKQPIIDPINTIVKHLIRMFAKNSFYNSSTKPERKVFWISNQYFMITFDLHLFKYLPTIMAWNWGQQIIFRFLHIPVPYIVTLEILLKSPQKFCVNSIRFKYFLNFHGTRKYVFWRSNFENFLDDLAFNP